MRFLDQGAEFAQYCEYSCSCAKNVGLSGVDFSAATSHFFSVSIALQLCKNIYLES